MDSLDSISLSKISWILHCNSDAAVSYSIFAPMAQGGFGMCGHKNYYSSSVRYGNWNEDRYGTEILTKREVPPLNYETEYTSNHRDPKTVSIDPKVLSVKLESLDELRAKNKEGLTYGLIFKHGEQDEPPQVRDVKPIIYKRLGTIFDHVTASK